MPPSGKETKKWFAIGLAVVIAWSAFLISQGSRVGLVAGDGPLLEGTGLNEPADYAWTLEDPDGVPVDFGKYRGKTVVLNLWATWCPPCREEMPSLARLAANPRMKEKGVVVVCASVDQSREALRSFLSDKDWSMMTILHAGAVPTVFASDRIPATYLIGPDGRIAAAQVGAAQWDDPKVIDFLDDLAGKPDLKSTPKKGSPVKGQP